MSCVALFAVPAMATMQFERSVCLDNSAEESTERIVGCKQPLRLNWVVVTDEMQPAASDAIGRSRKKTRVNATLK